MVATLLSQIITRTFLFFIYLSEVTVVLHRSTYVTRKCSWTSLNSFIVCRELVSTLLCHLTSRSIRSLQEIQESNSYLPQIIRNPLSPILPFPNLIENRIIGQNLFGWTSILSCLPSNTSFITRSRSNRLWVPTRFRDRIAWQDIKQTHLLPPRSAVSFPSFISEFRCFVFIIYAAKHLDFTVQKDVNILFRNLCIPSLLFRCFISLRCFVPPFRCFVWVV